MYGLFWLLVGLAEAAPTAILIDDAHWADNASLRFIHYLERRLEGVPLLVALAARPHEPGAQAQLLGELTEELDLPTLRPALLSEAATARLVRGRLDGRGSAEFVTACHEATGGNPLLVNELLADLDREDGGIQESSVAGVGPERISRSVIARAHRLDPRAEHVVRAVAVLGHGSTLRVVSELAGIAPDSVAAMVDALAAASIFAPEPTPRFAHPLLRTAVYDAIPAASRSTAHARACAVLRRNGAPAEEIAAHLLLTSPGLVPDALEVLDEVARKAARSGAPDSAASYLRRALLEPAAQRVRGELLRRLGDAEVALRDPAAIGHLEEAAELITEPAQVLDITLLLADVLTMAGAWTQSVEIIDAGLERFRGSGLPGVLDLEALRAGLRDLRPVRGRRSRARPAAAAGLGPRTPRPGVEPAALDSGGIRHATGRRPRRRPRAPGCGREVLLSLPWCPGEHLRCPGAGCVVARRRAR